VLVIPKRHAATLLDLSEEEVAEVARQVHRLSRAIVATLDPSGINVFQNNGVTAGQSIGHYHVHVLPSYPDAPLPVFTKREDLVVTPYAERVQLAERIRANLSG